MDANIGLARKHARILLKKIGCDKAPVLLSEVVRYLKSENDIKFSAWDFDDSVSGLLIEDEEMTAVGYNENHHVHRQRFTVAHELGHYIMSHNNQRKNEGFSLESNDPHEKEANTFASELLMPLSFLKEDLKKGNVNVEVFAEKYWVSKEAMGWRLRDSTVFKYI